MAEPATSSRQTPPVTRKSSRRLRRRRLLGLAAVCAGLFMASELGLRWVTRPTNRFGLLALTPRIPLLPLAASKGTVRKWVEERQPGGYQVLDPELGWSLGISAAASSNPTEKVQYTTNAQGFRAPPDRVYAPEPPPGKVRLVLLGDSFTHGDEVNLEDSWAGRLEKDDPRLETVNLGVPAYGTDQAFLRWRKQGKALQAHAVVLGIWLENVGRNLNVVRFWFSPFSGFLTKPRFVLGPGSEPRLVNSPVPEGEALVDAVSDPLSWKQIEHERWFEPAIQTRRLSDTSRTLRLLRALFYWKERKEARERLYSGEDPEGIAVTVAIARMFAAEVKETGAVPLVVVMPMRDYLEDWPEEWDLPLAVELKKAGLNVINLFPTARLAQQKGTVFLPSGHLTPEGHAAMARELAGRLPAFLPVLGERGQKPQ